MSRSRKYYIVSLGCPKNTVDSESMAVLLERAGYRVASAPERADLLIVNTCGFIAPAREESVATLHELIDGRRPGQRVIAAGCYAQRSPDELIDAVPGLDGVLGTRHWKDVAALAKRLRSISSSRPHPPEVCVLPEGSSAVPSEDGVHRVAIQGNSAYLMIADGCRRTCAFCAIPLIKGDSVSRPVDAILADARWLADRGIQEIILIAQDTTGYGDDLGMRDGLLVLLDRLVDAVPSVPWIRIMYAFPGPVVGRLMRLMAQYPQILPYLDIPLQHAHPDVLRRMNRPANVDAMRRMIEDLRTEVPGIALRTTFLTGFPGETEEEFEALLDFVVDMRFDRMGVFTYSHEIGTPADRLSDDVSPDVKSERRDRLMEAQQAISLEKNQALVGATLDVLIEGQGDGISVGRSYRDAPEVDCLVLTATQLPVGRIVPVRITAALDYDLVGEPPA